MSNCLEQILKLDTDLEKKDRCINEVRLIIELRLELLVLESHLGEEELVTTGLVTEIKYKLN